MDAEQALSQEAERADKNENDLVDCQEMLEEIQAFSEHQASEIVLLESKLQVHQVFAAPLLHRAFQTLHCGTSRNCRIYRITYRLYHIIKASPIGLVVTSFLQHTR